jgi:hypothetical protein
MSALSRMAAEASASKTQSQLPPKPKIDPAKELPKDSNPLGNGFIDSRRKSVSIPIKASRASSDRRFLSKYRLPVSQWARHASYVTNMAGIESPSSTSTFLSGAPRRTKQEDILDYVYDWAAWAAEIPDPSRRSEVLQSVMSTLERALKSGIERTGIALAPNDVRGTKTGTKKTLEGEVNIQVTITSNVREKAGEIVHKSAVRKAKDNDIKREADDTVATVLASAEPAPALTTPVEEASQAAQTKEKRAASEMDPSRVLPDIKRQKTDTGDGRGEEKVDTANAVNGNQPDGGQEKLPSGPGSPAPQDGEQKQARYRQQIFQTRLNHILRKAGKVRTRGRCASWETVVARLRDAGVPVKYRNKMLRDFTSGHEAWNGDGSIDPNEELAHFAEHGFEAELRKAAAANASTVKAETAKQAVVEPSQPETATVPTPLESLPASTTEPTVSGAFVPAQPVSPEGPSPHSFPPFLL